MRMRHLYIAAIAISVAAALPALADQSRGGSGQRSGTAMGIQRGMTQQDRMHDQDRLSDRDQIYGSQLMTTTERNAYRKKMRGLKTRQEREAFRMQHHEEMQKRAAARGVTLPDSPPARPGRAGMGNPAGVQQHTEQQERNQRQEQQIRQQQRTEQQEQQSQDEGG